MHRRAEKRRRWRLWERKEKRGEVQALEHKVEKCYKFSLDTRLLVKKGENKGQVKGKVGSVGFCHFCGSGGIILEKFPRRGYGKSFDSF